MSLLIIGSMAAAVATLANSNEDSPVLWGIVTFLLGFVGSNTFGLLGALLGCGLAAILYVAKMVKYG